LALLSPPPLIRLVSAFPRPFDNAVATARTCYAARGIVTPQEAGADAVTDPDERAQALARRDDLARGLYQAGHHTVFQHAHFQFAIDRVSRQALWAFFHAHPFYNSEQVSQRYVTVKRGTYLVPELPAAALEIYEATLERQEAAYRHLTRLLLPVAERLFFGIFPARSRRPDAWQREIRRKAQEAARYVLPVATWARLYHTISGVTLFRYRRLCEHPDVPAEVRLVVDAMVAEVLRWDPAFERVLEEPLPLAETPEAAWLGQLAGAGAPARAARFRQEFDAALEGRVSRLVSHSPGGEEAVAEAVREVLGLPRDALSDDEAIAAAADPARNPIYGEALNLTTLSPVTRSLHHAHYTFRRRLSHTADSQDQRHRMTPGSRPILVAQAAPEPDFVRPSLVEEDEAARQHFDETMAQVWESIEQLRQMGVGAAERGYLLPNAVAVRFTESADFLALRHKHAMRLCYNAQEEIWRASRDEALQIAEVHPRLGRFLLPPCSIRERGGARPFCPEGPRFCGVPVWRQSPREYDRRL
jgi:thymidylate synthase ThyX